MFASKMEGRRDERGEERNEGGDDQKIYGDREKRVSLAVESDLPFEAFYTPGIS